MTNLSETYSDGNGKTAKLRWEEYDVSGGSLNNHHISSSGGITAPNGLKVMQALSPTP